MGRQISKCTRFSEDAPFRQSFAEKAMLVFIIESQPEFARRITKSGHFKQKKLGHNRVEVCGETCLI